MSSPSGSIRSEEELDLERIIENDNNDGVPEAEEVNEGDNENEDQPQQQQQPAKPKRVIRNPRLKLDDAVLKGSKGIPSLESYFKNVKYKGAGHEAEDLRMVMKTYEYWCHRMFPKYPFDECISKIEKLGNKKVMQVYMKKIRAGLEEIGDPVPVVNDVNLDDDDDDIDEPQQNNEAFDNLLSESRTQDGHRTEEVQLTEDQLEMIRINRERALKIRMERLRKENENVPSTQSTVPQDTLLSHDSLPRNTLNLEIERSNGNDDEPMEM